MRTVVRPDSVVSDDGQVAAPLTLVKAAWVTRSGLLHISVTNDARRWTLALDGELDRSNVAALEQEILVAEAAEPVTITIDLRGLRFTDLSGVRTIARAHERARNGVPLRIVQGPTAIQRAFRLAGPGAEPLAELG